MIKRNPLFRYVVLQVVIAQLFSVLFIGCQQQSSSGLKEIFQNPPEEARPWTFWHWLHGALSKEGITKDLESMKAAGYGGAYLFTIRGVPDEPLIEPSYSQLTPEWWGMVLYAFEEAKRLDFQMGFHVSDGFALAGGPWITPELSMQKVVWIEKHIKGGITINGQLQQPETIENYYKDIAVLAYPLIENAHYTTRVITPKVTTSIPGVNASILLKEDNTQNISSVESCWIQYEFDQPFTCRAVTVRSRWADYQSRRLIVKVSDDGINFRRITRFEPPRMGWQDYEFGSTFAIETVTAKYFRFIYDPEGTEPGAEDLDPAKWTARLRLLGLELLGAPRINQYEGKSGVVWRITPRVGQNVVDDDLYVDLDHVIDITDKLDENGVLNWEAPEGDWTIIRMGHTSTGHTNATGGAAVGLECDKFNPEAVKLHFDNWFGAALQKASPDLSDVITRLLIDSWECGSQNWSPVFRDEFMKRRGYDLLPYLPLYAGVPLQNSEVSERFLFDVRQTVSELVIDNFFKVIKELAHEQNKSFSAESLSPIFVSDNMAHFREVDYPMGEFWLNSPSHDKPNDILDAISGARMYGKNIVQAEAFTQVRMEWDEYPANLKTLGDLNFALGINRFVFHVYLHNPWPDKKPGMTLDGIGLFMQRDQTWWEPGYGWIDYITRSQALLQQGVPVVDVAVFTGEEIPRRALLPDRLVPVLPGIFGTDRVHQEQQRLANIGQPVKEMPAGVNTSANMADPLDWTDPLNGYAYDSFNRDALIDLASVENGRIVLPGGSSYGILVVPGTRRMVPDGNRMSVEVARKLLQLVKNGATILFEEKPHLTPGLNNKSENDAELTRIISELWSGQRHEVADPDGGSVTYWKIGKGKVLKGSYNATTFNPIGIDRDLYIRETDDSRVDKIAWNHRMTEDAHIYFISNQKMEVRFLNFSFRVDGKKPVMYEPVSGGVRDITNWHMVSGRTNMQLKLDAGESVFIVFEDYTNLKGQNKGQNWTEYNSIVDISDNWHVEFDSTLGGPAKPVFFAELADWTTNTDPAIHSFSGSAVYSKVFNWNNELSEGNLWLFLGEIANIAQVRLNDVDLGVVWTAPYCVNITDAIRIGQNQIEITITNTWRNRLLADRSKPDVERIADFYGRWYIEGKPKIKAGLLGPVAICEGN